MLHKDLKTSGSSTHERMHAINDCKLINACLRTVGRRTMIHVPVGCIGSLWVLMFETVTYYIKILCLIMEDTKTY